MSAPMEKKNEIAQEKFGADFQELSGKERQSVGGTIGGETRKEQLGTEGYQEMGQHGGEARKEQMAAEHGGDASAGYSEMGSTGGKA